MLIFHSAPSSFPPPFLSLTLNSFIITYMFEFKQNLPRQLNALLIHVFDGDNISLIVRVESEKESEYQKEFLGARKC